MVGVRTIAENKASEICMMHLSLYAQGHNGKAEQMNVKTGGTADGFTEVFGDLHDGDVIAR